MCIEETSQGYLTVKIWKDSKYHRKNQVQMWERFFCFPSQKLPLPPPPPPPDQKKKNQQPSRKKGKKRVQAPRKISLWNTQTMDAIWHSMQGQCTSKLGSISPHTNKATMKPGKPQGPSGVYKVFTSTVEGKKFLTRSKTL